MIIQKVIETIPGLTKGKEIYKEWANYLKRIENSESGVYAPFTAGRILSDEDFTRIENYGPCDVEILNLQWDIIGGGFLGWKNKKFSAKNGKDALELLEELVNGEMKIFLNGKTKIKKTPFMVSYGQEKQSVSYTELETRLDRPLGPEGHYSVFIKQDK